MSESNKGRKRSPESIAKTAAALRGRHRSQETIRKISVGNIGKKRIITEKMRAANKARRGKPAPWVSKVNLRLKGKKKSSEHAEKLRASLIRTADIRAMHISAALKGRHKTKAQIEAQRGVKRSKETREAMSKAHKGIPLSAEHRRNIGLSHVGLKYKKGNKSA